MPRRVALFSKSPLAAGDIAPAALLLGGDGSTCVGELGPLDELPSFFVTAWLRNVVSRGAGCTIESRLTPLLLA